MGWCDKADTLNEEEATRLQHLVHLAKANDWTALLALLGCSCLKAPNGLTQPAQLPVPPDSALTEVPDDRFAGMIAAWLAAKAGRSGSDKTKRAYADVARSFRMTLQQVGHDLDADATAVALVAQAWVAQNDKRFGAFVSGGMVHGDVIGQQTTIVAPGLSAHDRDMR